jgi:hypothetical protein
MNPEQATSAAVRTYLREAPGSLFAGGAVELTAHWQGAENLLWRVDAAGTDAVVKMYLDAGWVRGRRQHDAHTAYAPLGLAPQPLWFDREPEGLSRQVLLYRYVEGETPDVDDAAALRALAEAAAAVHWGHAEPPNRISPRPLTLQTYAELLEVSRRSVRGWLAGQEAAQAVAAFDRLGDAARAHIERSLPLWQGAAPTPVHGDLSLENTLVAGGQVTLLEWEMSGLGDPALEIARFAFTTPFAGEEARRAWLEHHLAATNAPGLADRIAAYRALLPYEALCTVALGVQEHQPVLTAGDRADLATLLGALFVAAARSLDAPAADPCPLEPLLQPVTHDRWT